MINYKKLLSPLKDIKEVKKIGVYLKKDGKISAEYSSAPFSIDEEIFSKIISKEGVHTYKKGNLLAATICKENISCSIILEVEGVKKSIKTALEKMSKEVFLNVIYEQMCESIKNMQTLRKNIVTNISLQFRTPLSVIKGALSLLSEERLARLGPDAERLLLIAEKNVEKICEFIERLSQLAQIEYEGLRMNKRKVNVSKIVTEVQKRLKKEAESKKLKMKVKVGRRLFVMADPAYLSEALFQIWENAVHFTPPGGRIDVVAIKEKKRVKFLVSDTGIGIAPEDIEKVFSEFFRTDEAVLHHPRGSGLGLAIARSIIKAHGGDIKMESDIQKGCRVTFYLPSE